MYFNSKIIHACHCHYQHRHHHHHHHNHRLILRSDSAKGLKCSCCIADGYYCCVVDRLLFPHDFGMLISLCWVLAFLLHCLTFFLSKQTRRGMKIFSFYFFLFRSGRAKGLSREQCVAALCSSCSLQKYLERWPAALNEAGLSVLMLMKGSKIPRI